MLAFSVMSSVGSWSSASLVFGVAVVVCAALVLRSEFQDVRVKRVIAACAIAVVLAVCAKPLAATIYRPDPCDDPNLPYWMWVYLGCWIPS